MYMMAFNSKMILLMVIVSILPKSYQVKEGPASHTSPMEDKSLSDSDEHLPWEPVGEYVQNFSNIEAEHDLEEKLEDASDPPMLTEDLCKFISLNNDPIALDNVKVNKPIDNNPTESRRCLRTRWNVYSVCTESYVRYLSYRFCCVSANRSPSLSRRASWIRCRCLEKG
ncbi:uncharacterized protein [Palaemon carinicauda]|uniref:uncharacterized protein n=1 Tax=Palaemon carinicauda TaxID=392227 RepID=UPI0035B59E87